MTDSAAARSLHFYPTMDYACSYLPGRQARSQVLAEGEEAGEGVYDLLVWNGFRRSGLHVYRPACDDCRECVPVRLDVGRYSPNRSQRRAFRQHAELTVHLCELAYVEEHFQLYRRYQQARHSGGGMDQDDREQYESFILQSRVCSFLVEFREGGMLRMVSLIDQVADGLSSVYTFYDPAVSGASYGVYNVMWQAGLARQLGLPWLYLGYWIRDCRKMVYKTAYQPLQCLGPQGWQPWQEIEAAG